MRDQQSLERLAWLISMFNGFKDTGSLRDTKHVKTIKNDLRNLCKSGKITEEELSLVLRIYGIKNSDSYKPSVQDRKIEKINEAFSIINRQAKNWKSPDEVEEVIKELKRHKQISGIVEKLITEVYLGTESTINKQTKSSVTEDSGKYQLEDMLMDKGGILSDIELRYAGEDLLTRLLKIYKILEKRTEFSENDTCCNIFRTRAYKVFRIKTENRIIIKRIYWDNTSSLSKAPVEYRVDYIVYGANCKGHEKFLNYKQLIEEQISRVKTELDNRK